MCTSNFSACCSPATDCPRYLYLRFSAVAGPTHDRHPPFQWSTTNLEDDVPRFRTIDKFDFEPLRTAWNLS